MKLWVALGRYANDGRIEIDNNAAERSLRAVALGRKKYLFAGSDADGGRAAAIYSLIGSAKLNGIIQRRICSLSSGASPTIQLTGSLSCCLGLLQVRSARQKRLSRLQPDYCSSNKTALHGRLRFSNGRT